MSNSSLIKFTYLLLLLIVLNLGCTSRSQDHRSILIFAAASLINSLADIEKKFEEQSDLEIRVSYGASQMLAQQIKSGAPSDLFIPAGQQPALYLDKKALDRPTTINLLSNSLVIVTLQESLNLESLDELNTDKIKRIAIADPQLAPAGAYTKESLNQLELWDKLKHKIIIGFDVRATLAYVESGNADVAIVYRTDARVNENLLVLDIIPIDSYTPVIYPAVVVEASVKKKETRDFLNFLQSKSAAKIFRDHGFHPLVR